MNEMIYLSLIFKGLFNLKGWLEPVEFCSFWVFSQFSICILYIFRFQRFHVISAKLMKNSEVIFCIFNCKDRREGKGRRCYLGERIDSIPCRTNYFPLGWFEERDGFMIHPILHIVLVQFILFFISSWCNSSFSSNRPGTNS